MLNRSILFYEIPIPETVIHMEVDSEKLRKYGTLSKNRQEKTSTLGENSTNAILPKIEAGFRDLPHRLCWLIDAALHSCLS
jgi:hypothetical protein